MPKTTIPQPLIVPINAFDAPSPSKSAVTPTQEYRVLTTAPTITDIRDRWVQEFLQARSLMHSSLSHTSYSSVALEHRMTGA